MQWQPICNLIPDICTMICYASNQTVLHLRSRTETFLKFIAYEVSISKHGITIWPLHP